LAWDNSYAPLLVFFLWTPWPNLSVICLLLLTVTFIVL